MKYLTLVIAAILLAAIAWWVWQGDRGASDEERMVGIANPASVYCAEQGGTLEILSAEEGQVGYCHLPSGEVCEEWAYMRGECP